MAHKTALSDLRPCGSAVEGESTRVLIKNACREMVIRVDLRLPKVEASMPSPDDLLTIVEIRPLLQPALSDYFINRFLRQYGVELSPRKHVVKRSVLDSWLAGKLPPLPAWSAASTSWAARRRELQQAA